MPNRSSSMTIRKQSVENAGRRHPICGQSSRTRTAAFMQGQDRSRLFSSDIAEIEFRVVFLAVTVKNSNVRNSGKCQLRPWGLGFIIEHAFQTFAAGRQSKSGQYCEKHHLDPVDLGTRQGIRRQIASCRPGRRYAVQYIGADRTAADTHCAARCRHNCRGARPGAGGDALFCRQRRWDSPVFNNAQ